MSRPRSMAAPDFARVAVKLVCKNSVNTGRLCCCLLLRSSSDAGKKLKVSQPIETGFASALLTPGVRVDRKLGLCAALIWPRICRS